MKDERIYVLCKAMVTVEMPSVLFQTEMSGASSEDIALYILFDVVVVVNVPILYVHKY